MAIFNNMELKINYLTKFFFIFSITFAPQTFKIKIIMKKVSNVILVSLVLLATFLYSCDKEIETSPLTVDQTQKATIKGYVYANTDLTKFGDELAPAGTKVIITMAYNQIKGLDYSSAILSDTATVGSDGAFEYTVPTDADGVNVSVNVNFAADQAQSDVYNNITIKKTFIGSTTFYTVLPSQTQNQRIIAYENSQLTDQFGTVTISGTIYADYDLYTVGNEKIPAGTTSINFHTSNLDGFPSWSTDVTVSANGTFSVTVPVNETIYMNYDCIIAGHDASNNSANYKFYGTNSSVGSFTTNTVNKNLTFGTGIAQ
jgi:hypothetical protein